MKVGILGYSGYIGNSLVKQLSLERDVVLIGRHRDCDVRLDLENLTSFEYSSLDDLDYLIFTAAISGPDQCAQAFDKCWKINVESTSKIIEYALEKNCKVIFFSSDAVYGDISGKIYSEDDVANPDTVYGKMKRAVEEKFQKNSDFKAIRLSYVVSKRDKFVKYCLDAIDRNEIIEVFHPFYRSCTILSDVLTTVEWLIDNWEKCKETFINICGNELVSRVRIVDEIARIAGKQINYKIVQPTEEFFRNRPMITQTKPKVLMKYSIVNDVTFTEKIKKEFEMED